MHHKRKGPKSTRAGCLLCKPHKRQGSPLIQRQRPSQTKKIMATRGVLSAYFRKNQKR